MATWPALFTGPARPGSVGGRRWARRLSGGRSAQCDVSYIYKALDRRRSTGESGPNPNRGHRPRKLSGEQEAALAAHMATHPDRTLAQLQDWLEAEHGVRLSDGAIWAAVDRLGRSFKTYGPPRPQRCCPDDVSGLHQRIRSQGRAMAKMDIRASRVLIKASASSAAFRTRISRPPV